MTKDGIYLDHNATTPLAPELRAFVSEHLDFWGNPSSIHRHGRGPKTALRDARRQIAQRVGADALELIFTSCGSESNNLAFKGILKPIRHGQNVKNQILISSVEHPSVTKTAEALEDSGYVVRRIPISREGAVDLQEFQNLLTPETVMVSCMLANNETGAIFPIAEMVRRAHAAGALFHCDAVQALGKIPIDAHELGVDVMSFSGHKFYSLKGAGVLFVRRGLALGSLIHGGGQERGRRAGTENVLAIAALGHMCSFSDRIFAESQRLAVLRDKMEQLIIEQVPHVRVTGANVLRLPNTSSLIIDGVDGETLLMNLDMKGFSVSTGAACSSGSSEPSPALLAMGLSRAEAQSSLRLSLGWGNSQSDILEFVAELNNVVHHIRSFQSKLSVSHVAQR